MRVCVRACVEPTINMWHSLCARIYVSSHSRVRLAGATMAMLLNVFQQNYYNIERSKYSKHAHKLMPCAVERLTCMRVSIEINNNIEK